MIITHDLAIGGLQQVVVNICRSINREKFNVSVLCLRALGEFTPEIEVMGIKVFFLPQKEKGTDYFSFLKVARILQQEKVDVIHTHNTQPFIDGTIGSILSGRKIRIIHSDHARDFPDKKRYMFAEWLMSHFSYKIVGVSEHTTRNLIKYEKINPKKMLTIPNGIDGSKYNIDIDKDKKRKDLGINPTGPVIGLGVRLSEQKGITYLLQAMSSIIERFPDISLVIAGKGDLEEQLKNEANELGVSSNVFFVGPRLDIPELLKLFDLYVLPSLWEGLPMVILEAMAALCPIICTDVGGVAFAITHEFNGLLIKPGDSHALSSVVVSLLSDEGKRKQFARNGIKRFQESFSADIMTKKYEQIYLGQL
jgi:glycosyltransferase involved in cell wall biosynthesis